MRSSKNEHHVRRIVGRSITLLEHAALRQRDKNAALGDSKQNGSTVKTFPAFWCFRPHLCLSGVHEIAAFFVKFNDLAGIDGKASE
jgi:hypothetical protein